MRPLGGMRPIAVAGRTGARSRLGRACFRTRTARSPSAVGRWARAEQRTTSASFPRLAIAGTHLRAPNLACARRRAVHVWRRTIAIARERFTARTTVRAPLKPADVWWGKTRTAGRRSPANGKDCASPSTGSAVPQAAGTAGPRSTARRTVVVRRRLACACLRTTTTVWHRSIAEPWGAARPKEQDVLPGKTKSAGERRGARAWGNARPARGNAWQRQTPTAQDPPCAGNRATAWLRKESAFATDRRHRSND